MTYSSLYAPRTAVLRPVVGINAISIPLLSRYVLLGTLGLLLGLLYLVQATQINSNGYTLENYQQTAASLQKEHDELVLTSARYQSLDRVASSDVAASMVVVTPR